MRAQLPVAGAADGGTDGGAPPLREHSSESAQHRRARRLANARGSREQSCPTCSTRRRRCRRTVRRHRCPAVDGQHASTPRRAAAARRRVSHRGGGNGPGDGRARRRRRHDRRARSAGGTSGSGCSASTRPRCTSTAARPTASGPRPRRSPKQLLPAGTAVRLDRDVVGRDDYGRLLAYVYLRRRRLARQRDDRPPGLRPAVDDRAERRVRRPLRRRRRRRRGRRARPVGRVRRIASPRGRSGAPASPSLAERLGHPADARLVIISCDDLGLCHAANVGVYRAVREGAATCASLMVPAPWARHAAGDVRAGRRHRRPPHAERRAPQVPLGPDHPRPVAAVGRRRVPPLDRRPLGARRPRRGAPGVPGPDRAGPGLGHRRDPPRPPPHGDHAAARVLRRLPRHGGRVRACPIRLPSTITAEQAGFPFRRLAAEEGVVFPDHFDHDWRAGQPRARATAPSATSARGSPRSTSSRRSTRPRSGPCRRRPTAWIDDLALVVDDPGAAGPAGRGRRRADRLQRAQGRAASRVSALAAAPERSSVEQRPGRPGRLQLALHVGDRGIEPGGLHLDERHGDDELGVVGPVDDLVLLADDDPVLDARRDRRSRPLAGDGRAHALEQVASRSRRSGIGPTSDRARIQSSHGYTSASSSSSSPNHHDSAGSTWVAWARSDSERANWYSPTSTCVVMRWSLSGRSNHFSSNGDLPSRSQHRLVDRAACRARDHAE